jgi:UPF0755 protein
MKKVIAVVFVLLLLGAAGAYYVLVVPNINAPKRVSIKIPTGSTYADVERILHENNVLKDELTFSIVSKLKKYPDHINAGYYVFNAGLNNRQIVNILRAGLQTPVTLVIYNIRTKEEFAGLAGRTLELDSNELLAKLNDDAFCKQLKSDTGKILTRFIVDNYDFYWNVSQEKFFDKLNAAYDNFWNTERKNKVQVLNLSPTEVTILASITEKEVLRDKELPTVAGVYLNRLRINMPLQADPTLVFALHDFTAQRVTSKHKDFDSPYNTYKYPGLPPGAICMPRKKSIDAVLNSEEHPYLYFCANPDLSGYSIFAKTYDEQMETAAKYRKKLNEMNIH